MATSAERTLILTASLALVAGCAWQRTSARPARAAELLVGCWRDASGDADHVEVWTPWHGDVMYGQNLVTEDGRLRFFELLHVERRGDELVYVARPRGGDATEFRMVAHDTRSITFANPTHDFPRRIRYELSADGDGLTATIDDGTETGRRTELRWRRVR